MRKWHCILNGEQFGPIEETELRAWIQQGRLTASDNVWTEGMDAWAPARTALPDAFFAAVPPGAPVLAYALAPGDVPPNYAGTGGHSDNQVIMASARKHLSGHWGLAMGFCLLLGLLLMSIIQVPLAGHWAIIILLGPFELGRAIFFLALTRGGNTNLGMMFFGFNRLGTALGAYWLQLLFIGLWIIPGAAIRIIGMQMMLNMKIHHAIPTILMAIGMVLSILPAVAALSYSQMMFVIADDPTCGPLQAIRRSKQMMDGAKWRLFCLGLRYSLWAMACILTLGIGFLWLAPYISTGHASFYNDLGKPGVGGDQAINANTVEVTI